MKKLPNKRLIICLIVCIGFFALSAASAQENTTHDTIQASDTDNVQLSANESTVEAEKASTTTYCYSMKEKIGSKVKVSAYIYSEDDLNEPEDGTAIFKINGKTYRTAVKNGDAIFNVKLPLKAKTYKCSVKFMGNGQYKASHKNFSIKLTKDNVVVLKKNHKIKIGKYTVKLTGKQHRALLKAFNNDKSKTVNIKTAHKCKVKESYDKKFKKYRTLKTVKTFYSMYLEEFQKIRDSGWKLVSEKTFTKKNSQASEGIGLSAYTYSDSKWVKTFHKKAYQTKTYPVKAKIITKKSYKLPVIKLYAKNRVLDKKSLAIM